MTPPDAGPDPSSAAKVPRRAKSREVAAPKRGRKPSTVTKLDVVRYAATLFDRAGYDQTTVLQIASGLRISKPTLYNYFDGKTDILKAIFDEVIEGAEAIVGEAEQVADGAEGLRLFIQRSLEFGSLNRGMMNVFMSDERNLPSDERLRQRRWSRKWYRRLLLLVSKAQPSTNSVDARIATFAVTAFINQVGTWFSQKGELSLSEVAAGYCLLLEKGLLHGTRQRPA